MGSGLGICWQAHAASSAKKIKIEVGSDVFLTLELVTCHSTSAPDAFPPPLQGCVWSLERGVSHRCAPAALLGGTGQQAFSSQNKGKVKTIFFQKNCRGKNVFIYPILLLFTRTTRRWPHLISLACWFYHLLLFVKPALRSQHVLPDPIWLEQTCSQRGLAWAFF